MSKTVEEVATAVLLVLLVLAVIVVITPFILHFLQQDMKPQFSITQEVCHNETEVAKCFNQSSYLIEEDTENHTISFSILQNSEADNFSRENNITRFEFSLGKEYSAVSIKYLMDGGQGTVETTSELCALRTLSSQVCEQKEVEEIIVRDYSRDDVIIELSDTSKINYFNLGNYKEIPCPKIRSVQNSSCFMPIENISKSELSLDWLNQNCKEECLSHSDNIKCLTYTCGSYQVEVLR